MSWGKNLNWDSKEEKLEIAKKKKKNPKIHWQSKIET